MTKPIGSSSLPVPVAKQAKKPSSKIQKLAEAINAPKSDKEAVIQAFKQTAISALTQCGIKAKTTENTTNLMKKLQANPQKDKQERYLSLALEGCSQREAVEKKLIKAGLISDQEKIREELTDALTMNHRTYQDLQSLLQKVDKTDATILVAALDGAHTNKILEQIIDKMSPDKQRAMLETLNKATGKNFADLKAFIKALEGPKSLLSHFIRRTGDKDMQVLIRTLPLYPFALCSPEQENLKIFMTALNTGCNNETLLSALKREGGVVMNEDEIKTLIKSRVAAPIIQEILMQSELTPKEMAKLANDIRTSPDISKDYQAAVENVMRSKTVHGALSALKSNDKVTKVHVPSKVGPLAEKVVYDLVEIA